MDWDSDDSVQDQNYNPVTDESDSTSDSSCGAVLKHKSEPVISNLVLSNRKGKKNVGPIYLNNDCASTSTAQTEPSSNSQSENEATEYILNTVGIGEEIDNNNQNIEEEPSNNNEVQKSRKRKRDSCKWKSITRKSKHDKGEEYVSVRNKLVLAKRIKTFKNCISSCIYKCQTIISTADRDKIFKAYYSLSSEAKKLFLASTVQTVQAHRRRKGKCSETSRRKVTYNYFFDIRGTKVQVCKKFFCGTSDICQKAIYTALGNKQNDVSIIPSSSKQGKHRKHAIPDNDKKNVKAHIDSFPKVASHYCRSSTQKEYLEAGLSVARMYNLYVDKMTEKGANIVTSSFYRNIFNTEYNLSFYKPKKDRCNLCSEVELMKKDGRMANEKQLEYDAHVKEKNAMRKERQNDRDDPKKVVLCFDLQNVLTCPKAEIGQLYYRSKFSVYYNLTAHLSINKQVYCAYWTEATIGRKGNDIASALYKIIERMLEDNPTITEITMWSDSCGPQNKNSVMPFAMARMLSKHPNLKFITMKYSIPGHSAVQEVDSVHSTIDGVLKAHEYYSPVGLLRILTKQVSQRKKYKIIQMKPEDLHFQETSVSLNYGIIPHTKIKILHYKRVLFTITYKTSYYGNENCAHLNHINTRKSKNTDLKNIFLHVKASTIKNVLPDNKVSALRAMMPWMPQVDKMYFEAILPPPTPKRAKPSRPSSSASFS